MPSIFDPYSYLLTTPHEEINLTVIERPGEYLRALPPNAVIRSGDYSKGKGSLDISAVLSELANGERMEEYYN